MFLLRQRSKTTVDICVFGSGIFLGIKKKLCNTGQKNAYYCGKKFAYHAVLAIDKRN
jgi:hypothetical protein